ncbi:MAG TPA: ABC transporter substrate binding protein [bacterium]|nr:ABC transporter substrate binding protein [bacterium]
MTASSKNSTRSCRNRGVLPYIFGIGFLLLVAYVTSHRQRVLIVLSYHPEFSWEKEIADELEKKLSTSTVDVRLHYMDTKRHPSPEFKEAAGKEVEKIVESWDPDVLVTVDDNAQEYEGRDYAGRSRPSVVFCGVNASPERYGYVGSPNVTGILERISPSILIDVIPYCFPGAKRFMHLSDSSFTSSLMQEEFREYDWSPLACTREVMVGDFESWKKEVAGADRWADVILYTHYHTLRRSPGSDEIVPPGEVMSWTIANSPVPEIGSFGFMVRDGGMMAIAVSSREQADVAADYARRLLAGEPIADLPIVSTTVYSVFLNKARLAEAGVRMREIYTLLAETAGNVVE